MAFVVGTALAAAAKPYFQVGDLTLQKRVAALVEGGVLLADGNPWDMQNCRVKLAGGVSSMSDVSQKSVFCDQYLR